MYYSKAQPAEALLPYDMIVLDSDNHPPLAPLLERGKTVLGYVSLGEVEDYRRFYKQIRSSGALIKENKSWPGSHMVDVRNPTWARMVIEDIIPAILRQGFSGIFIDTLDNPIELERASPEKYRGMRAAAISLVKAIRTNYPTIHIQINRAYQILPDVATSINSVLGESMYMDYDFEKKTYSRVEEYAYRQQVKWLQELKKLNPEIAIYSLDYTQKGDVKNIAEIYTEQRKNGFIPYVSTLALDEIIPEPSR